MITEETLINIMTHHNDNIPNTGYVDGTAVDEDQSAMHDGSMLATGCNHPSPV